MADEDILRLRPRDWLPTIYDQADVERFIRVWVWPRLGVDAPLEWLDQQGLSGDYAGLLLPSEEQELIDLVSVCRERLASQGVDFDRFYEDLRHGEYIDSGDLFGD